MAEVASGEGVTAESALGEVISPGDRCAKPLTDDHDESDDYKDRSHDGERPERIVKEQRADRTE